MQCIYSLFIFRKQNVGSYRVRLVWCWMCQLHDPNYTVIPIVVIVSPSGAILGGGELFYATLFLVCCMFQWIWIAIFSNEEFQQAF